MVPQSSDDGHRLDASRGRSPAALRPVVPDSELAAGLDPGPDADSTMPPMAASGAGDGATLVPGTGQVDRGGGVVRIMANWCRSCGVNSRLEDATCASCGCDLSRPSGGPERVGYAVKLSRKLITRICVSLDESETGVLLLVKGDETTTVDAAEFDRFERIAIDGTLMKSAPGRLVRSSMAAERGELKAKWDSAIVRRRAIDLCSTSLAIRRAAALDWLVLGAPDLVSELELTASELNWYRAWQAMHAADVDAALGYLERLPADGYPARVALLAGSLASIHATPERASRAAALVKTFRRHDLRALALDAVLTSPDAEGRVALASDLCGEIASRDKAAGDALARLLESVRERAPLDRGYVHRAPNTFALQLYERGRSGESVAGEGAARSRLPLPMLDDLIDHGAINEATLPDFSVPYDAAYLRARLHPVSVSDEQMLALGHTSEYARRLYMRGDREGLQALAEKAPARAAHFMALLDVWTGTSPPGELLSSQTSELLGQVFDYLRRVDDDPAQDPPPAVLDDPTTWRLLLPGALQGRIRLTTACRSRAPQLALWLDIVGVERLALAQDWEALQARGSQLLPRVEDYRLRRELLSMVAYADMQTGDFEKAFSRIRDAIGVSPTESILVNAGIIASKVGFHEAADFLTRLFYESPDPQIGVLALLRAIDLWKMDPDSLTLPQRMIEAIRAALARPVSDEQMLGLLEIALMADRQWLAAGPTAVTSSPEQIAYMHFHVVSARVLMPGFNETEADITRLLVTLRRDMPQSQWVADRIREHIKKLDVTMTESEFGDAAGAAECVDVLIQAGLLTVAQALTLAPAAASHLIISQARHGTWVDEGVEWRLMFAPVDNFLQNRANFESGQLEKVEGEIRQALVATGVILTSLLEAEAESFKESWHEVLRLEAQMRAAGQGAQARWQVRKAQRELCDALASSVGRLSRYAERLARLPLLGRDLQRYQEIVACINTWSAELGRLRRTI